jgi:hypothetical protein
LGILGIVIIVAIVGIIVYVVKKRRQKASEIDTNLTGSKAEMSKEDSPLTE